MLFILSISTLLSMDVIADEFKAAEAILFRRISLISLIVFSNIGSA